MSASLLRKWQQCLFVLVLCGYLTPSVQGHSEFDANFTLQSIFGRLNHDVKSSIQCTSSSLAPNKIKITRLNTGLGTRPPKHSLQYVQGKPVSTRIFVMLPDDGSQRFGAFQCRIVQNEISTETVTLKLPPLSEAELDASLPYQVANLGDDVEFNITVLKEHDKPIQWIHDNKVIESWTNQTLVNLTDVKQADSGIYEAFYSDHRAKGVHALIRLIVRSCPAGYYGDHCIVECPLCYNGGICHDKWGECICPAGFTGPNCQTACGANRFGDLCDKLCTASPNDNNKENGCASFTFCKPDPYGCSCASGFRGPHCMGHCEPGWYGPDCRQPCHCAYGGKACNRITGFCNGGCADGWRGESCEIDDPDATAGTMVDETTMPYCPVGYFGASCDKPCHCADDEVCNFINGQCPSGCTEGWGGFSCSECVDGRFGDNCEDSCHCIEGHSMCDKEGYCYAGCEAGWTGFTCQQECTPGVFGQNCASTCHCLLDSDVCNKTTGLCSGNCEPGFMGRDCQTLCPQSLYGVNCKNVCTCLNGAHCSRIDGTCACEGKWRSKTCNESVPQIVAGNDEEINVGQPVFISCTSDAVPEPEMFITSDQFPGVYFIVRVLEKNQYQAVMKVTPETVGEFQFSCSVKNPHGFDSRTIALFVVDPPRLVKEPGVLRATNNSITVDWDYWEFGVDEGGRMGDHIEYMLVYREVGESKWSQEDQWSSNSTATIENLQLYTEYEVAVKSRRPNKGGEGDPGPHIKVRTKCGDPLPEAIPVQFLPDEITPNFVRLTWKDPPDSLLKCELIGYNLVYFVTDNNTSKGINSINLNDTSNELVLHDIAPSSLYEYRLYPVTISGRSQYYAELIFRTAELIPGPVEDLAYVAVEESGSLFIHWRAPSVMRSLIKSYNVTYELTDRGHCGRTPSDLDLQGVFWTSTSNTEVILIELQPYSTYFITVSARTGAGDGDASQLAALTAEASPGNAPPNVNVASVASTSLEFHWDPIPCESANGIVVEYEYTIVTSELSNEFELSRFAKIKRSADVVSGAVFKKVKGLRASVDHLQPYTAYEFAVRGYTTVGAGPFSKYLSVRTNEGVPSAPRDFILDSLSSHRITVSWKEPLKGNGVIQQYRIRCQVAENPSSTQDLVYNATLNETTTKIFFGSISDLEGGMGYTLKVQASTVAGWGDWSPELLVLTSEDVPDVPVDVEVVETNETTMLIAWNPPNVRNGKITGYKISYNPLSSLDSSYNVSSEYVLTQYMDGSATNAMLTDLHSSTQYCLMVQARTSLGYGLPETLLTWTTIKGDHISPTVKTLNFEATNETISVVFSTEGKSKVHKYQVIVEDSHNLGPIDEDQLSDYETAVVEKGLPYYIAAELDPENITDAGQQPFTVGDRKKWGNYSNVHLNPGHPYRIRIRTIIREDSELKSVLSDPRQQIAMTLVSAPVHQEKRQIFGLDLIPFILIVSGILLFNCVAAFFIVLAICRRKEKGKHKRGFSNRDSGLSESLTWSVTYKAHENEACDGPVLSDGWKYSSTIDKSSMRRSKTYAKNCPGIRIENLADYVYNTCNTLRLSEEFKQLVSGQTAAWTLARKSENLKKNRYGNILPYDKYRVVLEPEPGASDSDYINASYVDGYRRQQEYIITQGPLESTIVDFWRMVWQTNSPVIVMLTDQVENGKVKCAKYWPHDSIISGNIHILNIYSEECNDFIIQTLLLRKADEAKTHRVMHYRFTGWSDRSVPLDAYPLLKMINRLRSDNPVLGGPMIVHCSAGAGRSGTFIAIDALIQQAHDEKRVDVFRFVNNARLQRINLVQTQEQYLFVHEALLEALLSEDTSVPLSKIAIHLKCMRESFTLDPKSLIRKQFQMLKHSQKKFDVSSCSSALSECNIFKNRDPMTVPADSSRICLHSEADYSDAFEDYINAVYVDGFAQRNAYVVTQMPLQHTVEDFWELVYQTKSSLILMLNICDEEDEMNIGQYWPDNGHCRYGKFEVQVVTFEDHGDVSVRIMKLINLAEPSSELRKLIQLQYRAWHPTQQTPKSPDSMLHLLNSVDLWYHRSAGGPITVHCMDGSLQCGLFCVSAYIHKQIRSEKVLDVYQAVKNIRIHRPEFVSSLEQFAFCFEVASALVKAEIGELDANDVNTNTLSCKV